MERESFESEEVAKILNEHFVPIKVDREERPDVDRVYMTYVQVDLGNVSCITHASIVANTRVALFVEVYIVGCLFEVCLSSSFRVMVNY